MRFLPAGDTALLVELGDLEAALALFQHLQTHPLDGVSEVVPAARTVLLTYLPWKTCSERLAAQLWQQHQHLTPGPAASLGRDTALRRVEIPVQYDGADLAALAEHLGMSVAHVIERHTAPEYQAAFAGFAPGFVYLAGGHPDLRVPRLDAPRTRVPAGSVAIAGEFSAIYPKDSPGGWQLLGTTPCTLWDMQRPEPALLQPGFRVRFLDMARSPAIVSLPVRAMKAGDADRRRDNGHDAPHLNPALPASAAGITADAAGRGTPLHCLAAGLQTLVQDAGRPGQTGLGIAASGALDRGAMQAANRTVGNPPGTAVLENLLGQLQLRCDGQAVVAVTGAAADVHITTPQGHTRAAACYQPLALYEGDVLSIAAPRAGMRCYVAVRGGLDVPPVLGSRASDTLAQIGPAPLRAGDTLWTGRAIDRAALRPVSLDEPLPDHLSTPLDTVTLDIVLGPRTDWFTHEAIASLLGQSWAVTPQSNRIGIRLNGAQPLIRRIHGELPSEGTVVGAIQVPANGQPVLFLADRPLTGGYPVIGAVVSHHLDRAAQIPVGAHIRFRATGPFTPPHPQDRGTDTAPADTALPETAPAAHSSREPA